MVLTIFIKDKKTCPKNEQALLDTAKEVNTRCCFELQIGSAEQGTGREVVPERT